uniref:Syntaxin 10 n=1 Tax=Equus asinus asinus TaxID=83772 RepID=A0A8C4L3L6_EQUAS
MSLEDPFFVVRGEVQKAVNTARGLYQRWCELLQEGAAVGREELDWTTNELRNGLRSIEWDLEDLEETIDILGVGGRHGRAHCGDRGHLSLPRGAAGRAAGGIGVALGRE